MIEPQEFERETEQRQIVIFNLCLALALVAIVWFLRMPPGAV